MIFVIVFYAYIIPYILCGMLLGIMGVQFLYKLIFLMTFGFFVSSNAYRIMVTICLDDLKKDDVNIV